MDNENLKLKLGKFCKDFRINELLLSLTDFSNNNNISLKNVWAFENGKSSNLKYLFYYYNSCKGCQKDNFIKGVFGLWL